MRLKTVSQLILEAMDPNYRKWRKANVTYRGTRDEHAFPLDGINDYEGKFGKGLYTTPLSNKAMTKDYGKTWIIVGAIPKNPLKFKSINSAEIWLQDYAIKNGKGKDEIDKLRDFWKKHNINDEVKKLGYDGIEVVGREMVLFDPDKDKLRAFQTEKQLEMWYDDFHEGETGPVKWKEEIKEAADAELTLDDYQRKLKSLRKEKIELKKKQLSSISASRALDNVIRKIKDYEAKIKELK